jgi:Mg-chelatase subunit ChlD
MHSNNTFYRGAIRTTKGEVAMTYSARLVKKLLAVFLFGGLSLTPVYAQDNLEQATDLVESMMFDHLDRFNSGRPPLLNDPDATKLYFVDIYAVPGLQGKLGFDPVFDAQDADIRNISIGPDAQTPVLRGAAQIVASFTNFGQPQTMLYTLVKVPPHNDWQINDIYSDENGWSLARLSQDFVGQATGGNDVTLFNQQSANSSEENTGMEQGDTPGFDTAQNSSSGGNSASASLSPASSDILFMLDGSGSMWGQLNGVAKISTAKTALSGLVSDLHGQRNIGLMVYGHRREGDCGDTEMILQPGDHALENIQSAINNITPRGKTPIARSLMEAGEVLSVSERPSSILLISDGMETCSGDPCAAAAQLAARGIDTRVHVVGFDLSEQEAAALQCIADNGNGRYFSANTADEFVQAVNDAVEEASAPPPPPPAPPQPETAKAVFEELFDGPNLDPAITVENPVPEYVTFTGEGTRFVSVAGALRYDAADASNRHIVDTPLPEGDFDLVLEFSHDMQSLAEQASVSLFTDAFNHVSAVAWIETQGCGSAIKLSLVQDSGTEGDVTRKLFTDNLFDGPFTDDICSKKGRAHADMILQSLVDNGALLRLKRRGREMTAEFSMDVPGAEGEPSQKMTKTTEPVSMLRLSGKPAFLVGQAKSAGSREGIFELDRFAIEQPPQGG